MNINISAYEEVLSVSATECREWCISQLHNATTVQLQPLGILLVSLICQAAFVALFTNKNKFPNQATVEYGLLLTSFVLQLGFVMYNIFVA